MRITVLQRLAMIGSVHLVACTFEDSPQLGESDQAIIGGTAAAISDVPWQVMLTGNGDPYGNFPCGGSIVDASWILTAQHCVDGDISGPPAGDGDLRIVAGIADRTNQSAAQIRAVDAVARYPSYFTDANAIGHHDFALLHLASPLDLSGPNARAIPLVTAVDVARGVTNQGVTATVSGWGKTSVPGSYSTTLQKTTVPIVANGAYADELNAGGNGHDSCVGDSGGPLTVMVGGTPKLAGVVSYGPGNCGAPGTYGSYARVSSVEDWITLVISSNVTGTSYSGISGSAGAFTNVASFVTPAGAATFSVMMTDFTASGNQQADLYVRRGGWPTTTLYDCRPGTATSREACTWDGPTGATWYVAVRGTNQAFANIDIKLRQVGPSIGGSMKPAPADYDNDGITDIGVKYDTGLWRVDLASNGFGTWDVMYAGRGDSTATPVPGDYDGDGATDLSIKTTLGWWYIDYASNGLNGWDISSNGYGGASNIPVPGDYDGDGTWDLATKNNSGYWQIDYTQDGYFWYDFSMPGYGDATAIPVPADYDNDGKLDLAIKNSTGYGEYNIDYSSDGFGAFNFYGTGYGGLSAVPMPGNFDGVGGDDISVKENATGVWYFDYASYFGLFEYSRAGYGSGGTPVIGDYNGDGASDLALLYAGNQWCVDFTSTPQNGWDFCVVPQ